MMQYRNYASAQISGVGRHGMVTDRGVGHDHGADANARLTGYAALVLLVLLAVESVTGLGVRRLITAHVLTGFLLVPPVLLKLGSVGYRFARYYVAFWRGTPRPYRPPDLAMRLMGPVVVLLTILVVGSGLALWLFGLRFGSMLVAIHHGSAYLWFIAMAIHVLAYLRRAPELAAADWRDHMRGALARRALVIASLVLGGCLMIAMLPFPTPFSHMFEAG
jgi:hypothetical protein